MISSDEACTPYLYSIFLTQTFSLHTAEVDACGEVETHLFDDKVAKFFLV